jgi:serine protease Do
MKRKTVILAFAALLAALLAALPLAAEGDAPEKKADARVEEMLKRLDLKYSVNASGNVAVTYDSKDERSQTVYIMSKTDTASGVEIREIWSNAGTFEAEPEAGALLDLMSESGMNKIGSWALEKLEDGKYLLFYTIKFPADATDDAYRMMLEFASSVADAREQALFGGDDN